MRELKFRAWALRRDNTMGWIYSDDESNLSQYFDWTEDFEQQAYTGFKDKNGKFIYEGDIVCDLETEIEHGQDTPLTVNWWHNGWFAQDARVTINMVSSERMEIIGNNQEGISNGLH